MARTLFLFCYDIADARRQRQVRRYLQGYKVEGQKSVFECWMTATEYTQVMEVLSEMINAEEDRIHVFRLDPRQKVRCFGLARHFTEKPFIIG
ncbi:MAG: CRISPR-associated endonuclease Cas2 [Alcanivoracaceae bacterium]